MLRKLGIALAALVLVAGAAVVWLYHAVTTLEYEPVTPSLSVVQAGGINGNVAILATPEGALVVDTMTFRQQGARIRELAERLAGAPVTAVVNTHYHLDHTHGNPGFPAGTQVVATRQTREYMLALDAEYWSGKNGDTLPNDLVDAQHELRVGGKTVRLLYLGRGHTGGDLVVHFVEDRVVHLGDLLVNGRYPNVDLEAGGSIAAWDATLDRVLALDFDRVIPGHGPVTDRAGIARFQAFLREVWGIAQQAARERLPLEKTQELARRTLTSDAGFVVIRIPGIMSLDRDFVVGRAWEEATGAVRPAVPPAAGGGG
jgi:glyoxylase-like metal-dependent hydrolase (beta-lactamase superfamily II)